MRLKQLLLLEKIAKYIFIVCLIIIFYGWCNKDKLPNGTYYINQKLNPPVQTQTDAQSFVIRDHQQRYRITPLFDYQLEGIVVSYSNANQIGNIWHHRRWQDFVNVRDLCLIWGSNVKSNIFKKMHFSSDSWTCWVSTSNHQDWQNFNMNQLSNNHLLAKNDDIKKQLMKTELGDQIQIKGMLVNYKNLNNGYTRQTSTVRDDKGNGACETIYITELKIIKKANPKLRALYNFSKYLCFISFLAYLISAGLTPKQINRNF